MLEKAYYTLKEICKEWEDSQVPLSMSDIIQSAIQETIGLYFVVTQWILAHNIGTDYKRTSRLMYLYPGQKERFSGKLKICADQLDQFLNNNAGHIERFFDNNGFLIETRQRPIQLYLKNDVYISHADKIFLERNLKLTTSLEATKNSPYLDPNHSFYSSILADCINIWMYYFDDNTTHTTEQTAHMTISDKIKIHLKDKMKYADTSKIDNIINIVLPATLQNQTPAQTKERLRSFGKAALKKNPNISLEEIKNEFSAFEESNGRQRVSIDMVKKSAPKTKLLAEINQENKT